MEDYNENLLALTEKIKDIFCEMGQGDVDAFNQSKSYTDEVVKNLEKLHDVDIDAVLKRLNALWETIDGDEEQSGAQKLMQLINRVTKIEVDYNVVNNSITNVLKQVASLVSRVEANEQKVASAANTLVQHDRRIQANLSRVESVEGRIVSTEKQTATNTAGIEELRGKKLDVSSASQTLKKLEAAFASGLDCFKETVRNGFEGASESGVAASRTYNRMSGDAAAL